VSTLDITDNLDDVNGFIEQFYAYVDYQQGEQIKKSLTASAQTNSL
jgi:hypothetical protein